VSDFKGKAAVVTGAGVGIGYAVCAALAQAGATVCLNDIDQQLAHESAETINSSLGVERVFAHACDVADVAAVRRMIDSFAVRCERLDIVVANAGITSYAPFLEETVANFDRIHSVNVRGAYFTCQAAARHMIELGTAAGRLLLLSSVTGVRALAQLGAYGITKAAVRHMAQSLAVELGPSGITVNAIAPGATLTERTLSDEPNYESIWAELAPNGRVGRVSDIASLALFLCSPRAGHITGQTIVVDGGWTLQSPMPG
jgi:3-oxoacyl-[acyl-carrier protein] reductase